MATFRGGLLLVAAGLVLTLLARERPLGLVIAFAGVTLLAYGVLGPHSLKADDGKEPPIF
jgi:hypothetical protein